MEGNYIFQLSEPLKISKDGKFEETLSIEFTPPDMAVFEESTDFEQLMMGSMMSAAEGQAKPDAKDEEGGVAEEMKIPNSKEIRMLIFASQKVKIKNIASVFKKIALKTGWVDEGVPLKDSYFNKMSKDDFINMLCGYSAFFTFPSLLRGG